jgi:hypothetical protein
MTEADDRMEVTAASTDARRLARLAQIAAEQAHGEQLIQRYGRQEHRPRFAVVGYAELKRRCRR